MRIVIETDEGTGQQQAAASSSGPEEPATDAGPSTAGPAGRSPASGAQAGEPENAGPPPQWLVDEIERQRAEEQPETNGGPQDAGSGPET